MQMCRLQTKVDTPAQLKWKRGKGSRTNFTSSLQNAAMSTPSPPQNNLRTNGLFPAYL